MPLTFSCGQRETLDIMNAFVNSDWNYTGKVNPEENEQNDEENTGNENFVRTSSNSRKCNHVMVLVYKCCCCSRFISRI